MTRLLTTGVLLAAVLAGAAGAQCNTQPLIGSIGQGTPGTNGVPTLTSAVPLVNAPYGLSLGNGLPNAVGAVVAGFGARATQFPMYGATLYPDPPLLSLILLDGQGSSQALTVNSPPAIFCGGDLVAQCAVLDPGAQGGVAFTRALQMRFGGGGGRGLAIIALRDYGFPCPQSISNLNVIDVANMRVASSFSINQDHLDIAVTSNGALAVATNACSRLAVILDMTTNPPAVVGQVPVPLDAEDVDIADERFAIITAGTYSQSVSSVDLLGGQLVNTVVLPIDIQSLDASADGSYALVTSFAGHVVRRLDIAANGTISDSGVEVVVGANTGLMNIAITPRGDQALACNHRNRTIEVLADPAGAMSLSQTVSLPAAPQSVAIHPNGDLAYVFMPSMASVEVLSRAANGSWSSTTSIAVPEAGQAYLAYWGVESLALLLGGTRLVVHGAGKAVVVDTTNNQVLGSIVLNGADTAPSGGIASVGL